MAGAIRHGLAIGHGHGPLDHFWQHRSGVRSAGRTLDGRSGSTGVESGFSRTRSEPYTEAMTPLLAIGPDAAGARAAGRGGHRTSGAASRLRRRGRDVSGPGAQPQRRPDASDTSSTRPTSRWRSGRSSGSPAKSQARWPGVRLALHHRIGRLEIGEASVAIAAASAHRADAFARLPLHDRAGEADRADLEARVLRGRRRLDRGRDRRSGRCAARAKGGAGGMRVTVRLFARLRDIAGAAELAREVAPGATIGTVWRQLVGEFPELAGYERSISSAVNADYARMDQPVRDGDEVAFLPPVSGG